MWGGGTAEHGRTQLDQRMYLDTSFFAVRKRVGFLESGLRAMKVRGPIDAFAGLISCASVVLVVGCYLASWQLVRGNNCMFLDFWGGFWFSVWAVWNGGVRRPALVRDVPELKAGVGGPYFE